MTHLVWFQGAITTTRTVHNIWIFCFKHHWTIVQKDPAAKKYDESCCGWEIWRWHVESYHVSPQQKISRIFNDGDTPTYIPIWYKWCFFLQGRVGEIWYLEYVFLVDVRRYGANCHYEFSIRVIRDGCNNQTTHAEVGPWHGANLEIMIDVGYASENESSGQNTTW